jgi:hypothetical protein
MAAIVGNTKKGMAERMRAVEVAAAITTTKSDRLPLERRLKAAEVAGSIAAPTTNPTTRARYGVHNRLKTLEAHVW